MSEASKGIVGTTAPVSKVTASGISAQVDSTATDSVGKIVWYRDVSGSTPRVSAIKYYKAGASVRLGAVLKQDTAARDSNRFIECAVTDAKFNYCKGIAAAAVSNTGYFSWCYVGGYVPEALMPTNYASNQYMMLSATEAGKLTSAFSDATAGNATGNWTIVFQSFSVASGSSGGSTSSGVIVGWLG